SGRYFHSAVLDPVRDRLIVFGGGYPFTNDLWALDLASSPTWTQLAPKGAQPSPRGEHTATYDPVHDQMVVIGGQVSNQPTQPFVNEVWALSLSGAANWNELTPAGTPMPGRAWLSSSYDSVRNRIVVFGGSDQNGPYFADVWE